MKMDDRTPSAPGELAADVHKAEMGYELLVEQGVHAMVQSRSSQHEGPAYCLYSTYYTHQQPMVLLARTPGQLLQPSLHIVPSCKIGLAHDQSVEI